MWKACLQAEAYGSPSGHLHAPAASLRHQRLCSAVVPGTEELVNGCGVLLYARYTMPHGNSIPNNSQRRAASGFGGQAYNGRISIMAG